MPRCSAAPSVAMMAVWALAGAMVTAVLVSLLEPTANLQSKGFREQYRVRRAVEAAAVWQTKPQRRW